MGPNRPPLQENFNSSWNDVFIVKNTYLCHDLEGKRKEDSNAKIKYTIIIKR